MLWLRMLATILNRPVTVPMNGDVGAAFGAARLGMAAVGDTDPRKLCPPPPVARTIEPDRRWQDAYADRLGQYRSLYPALRAALP
jgi:xylulokinase